MEKEAPKSREIDFESLTKGFKKASDIVRMEKPDYLLAPVSGSVPFIDLLHIVDRHFDLGNVIYIPNSSRFGNREELMANWYSQFYDSHEVGEPIKFMCVDEVLSGSSAVVGYRQFQRSIEERAKKRAEGLESNFDAFEKFKRKLGKQISYKILGLAERGYNRNPEFKRLQNKNLVHLIEFDDIPTIDNVVLNPIRFKVDKLQPNGKPIYLPEVERFDITHQYMDLLKGFAEYCGVDPSTVNPVNLSKIESGLKQSQTSK